MKKMDESSSDRLMLRLKPTEHAELRRLAYKDGLTVGQLMRVTMLAKVGIERALEAGDMTPAEAWGALEKLTASMAKKSRRIVKPKQLPIPGT